MKREHIGKMGDFEIEKSDYLKRIRERNLVGEWEGEIK